MFDYLGHPTIGNQLTLLDIFPDLEFTQATAALQNMQSRSVAPGSGNIMAVRLEEARQAHLQAAARTPVAPEVSPFQPNSPLRPATSPGSQPSAALQIQWTSISPNDLMLAHSLDIHRALLLGPGQQYFEPAGPRNPSNLLNSASPEGSMEIYQQYQFVDKLGEPLTQAASPGLPDVPICMLSMESREGSPEPWSSQPMSPPRSLPDATRQRQSVDCPVDTSSDSAGYSCTYHGCRLRFDTLPELRQHKRESHRRTRSGSSSSPDPALRPSQDGPHRCDRINPHTRKPCHATFSRPYDLTRHEDTIHNARKRKLCCDLCKKRFRRQDALTRHIRVIHLHTLSRRKRGKAK